MKKIYFIGDSFCSCYSQSWYDALGRPLHQAGFPEDRFPAHPTLVAQHYNAELVPHGYAGKGWWYYRSKFISAFANNSPDDTVALIFFHTEPSRINNATNPNLLDNDYQSYIEYFTLLHDQDFYDWACINWFKEIQQQYHQFKTIHFHCFSDTLRWSHYLPGMVYTTPLIKLGIGQYTGTPKQIEQTFYKSNIPNHLTSANNHAMAKLIIDSVDNYCTGQQPIDLTRFDQPNPNAARWPNGPYGTV